MAAPPDKDNTQALTAIAVHLGRLDERSESSIEHLVRIEGGVEKINDRLRKVENEQSALRDRMKWISGIVSGAVAGVIGLFIKSST